MKNASMERAAAERAVLGAMLVEIDAQPAAVYEIAATLSPAMFADPIRAEILAAILEAVDDDRPGVAAVAAIVRRRAAAAGDDHQSAVSTVAELLEERVGPDAIRTAELAAEEVRDAYGRRRLVDSLQDALSRARDPRAQTGELVEALDRLADVRERLTSETSKPVASGLVDILDRWARNQAEPIVPTMFGPLERRLGGGLPVGLTGIAAKPGEGKSALALQLTLGALLADREARAVWFRGEMTNDLLAGKMLAIWSALREQATPPATFKDARRRADKARKVAVDLAGVIGDRLQVVDPPLTPEALEREIVRHKPRLAVVDYLQLCEAGGKADRRAEVESVTRHLARLSTAHEVAIVVVSALAKATSEASGIGSLAKESNLLDYDVHTFLTLWGDGDREADPREVRLKIEKSRTAIPGEIPLYFSGSGQYFTAADLADVEGYDEFAAFAPEALA